MICGTSEVNRRVRPHFEMRTYPGVDTNVLSDDGSNAVATL